MVTECKSHKGGREMEKRKIQIEDLSSFVSVASPKISPNEGEAFFLRTMIDEEENDYVSTLFHIDLESGDCRQWTHGKERISSPAWSPDGKQIAFLSNRDHKNQVYVMQASGGEARMVTDFPKGVTRFQWAWCGEKIWVNGPVREGGRFVDEEEEVKEPTAYRVTTMKYKADGIGLHPQDTYRHIGLVDLTTGEVTPFTEGNFDYDLLAVSHKGDKLVVGVNRMENQDNSFKRPLYLVDIVSKEETTIVDVEGTYGHAVFSPDDAYIAYIGADRRYENATQPKLFVYKCETGRTTCLTEGIDAPVGDLAVADAQQGISASPVMWTKDHDLYFQLSTMGDVRLYYASLDGMIFPASPELEHIYDYAVATSGRFALVAKSDAVHPGELYQLTITTGERKALTSMNEDFVDEVELIKPEAIMYQGANDWDIHGWLMKPVGFEVGKRYPLIVEIHGGPATMYANTFFHEMQVLAAKGYGVLYVNPRGSHGYSQAFVDAVRGDYGGGDYADIMAGLDYVLSENEWIDANRLGVTGGSYGGFLTNWIVGKTNRFQAAVTQRSISNWVSFYGVSDIGYYFSEWQHGVNVYDIGKLWDLSPLKYAENIETPLLILHSEKDLRCPIEQAEQLYMTLKRMGKTVEFVRFPEADHNLSRMGKPSLRKERLEEIVDWMEKYT